MGRPRQIATLVTVSIDVHPVPDRPQPIHRAQNGREHDPRQRQPAMLAHMDAHPAADAKTVSIKDAHGHKLRRHVHHRHHWTHLHRHRPRPPGAARQRQPHGPNPRIRLLPLLPGLNMLTLTGATAASLAYRPLTLI